MNIIPRIAAIIISFGREQDLQECLLSIQASTWLDVGIFVLTWNPTQSSAQPMVSSLSDENVQVYPLQSNQGYAGNNNIGLQLALAQGFDWLLVLNDDTVLDRECIRELIQAGMSNPQIGVLGPMIYHANESNVIQSAGGKLDSSWRSSHAGMNEQDGGQFTQTRDVDWLSGCAILLRRTALEQVGLFDEDYFCYWEETDWCVRARACGWQLVHVPQAKLWHKGVQRDYEPSPFVVYYFTRNRLLFLLKHRAPVRAWAVAWMETLRPLVSWSIQPRWRHKHNHRNAIRQAVVDFLARRSGMQPVREAQ